MKVFINENKNGFDEIIIEKPFFKGSEFTDLLEIFVKAKKSNEGIDVVANSVPEIGINPGDGVTFASPAFTPVLEFNRADGVKIGRIMTSTAVSGTTSWLLTQIDNIYYYKKTFALNTLTGVLAVKGKLEINILLYEMGENNEVKIYSPGVVVNQVNGVRSYGSAEGYNIYVDDSIDGSAYKNLLLDKTTILANLALLESLFQEKNDLLESKKLAFEDNKREKISLNTLDRTKIGSQTRAKFGVGDGLSLDNSEEYLYFDFEKKPYGYKLNLKNGVGNLLSIAEDGSILMQNANADEQTGYVKAKYDGSIEVNGTNVEIRNRKGASIEFATEERKINFTADSLKMQAERTILFADELSIGSLDSLVKSYTSANPNVITSNVDNNNYNNINLLLQGAKILIDSSEAIFTGGVKINDITKSTVLGIPNDDANLVNKKYVDDVAEKVIPSIRVSSEYWHNSVAESIADYCKTCNFNSNNLPQKVFIFKVQEDEEGSSWYNALAFLNNYDDELIIYFDESWFKIGIFGNYSVDKTSYSVGEINAKMVELKNALTAKIESIVGNAPEALDTLLEIANALNDDSDAIAAINSVINTHISTSEAKFAEVKNYIDTKENFNVNNSLYLNSLSSAYFGSSTSGKLTDKSNESNDALVLENNKAPFNNVSMVAKGGRIDLKGRNGNTVAYYNNQATIKDSNGVKSLSVKSEMALQNVDKLYIQNIPQITYKNIDKFELNINTSSKLSSESFSIYGSNKVEIGKANSPKIVISGNNESIEMNAPKIDLDGGNSIISIQNDLISPTIFENAGTLKRTASYQIIDYGGERVEINSEGNGIILNGNVEKMRHYSNKEIELLIPGTDLSTPKQGSLDCHGIRIKSKDENTTGRSSIEINADDILINGMPIGSTGGSANGGPQERYFQADQTVIYPIDYSTFRNITINTITIGGIFSVTITKFMLMGIQDEPTNIVGCDLGIYCGLKDGTSTPNRIYIWNRGSTPSWIYIDIVND